MGTYCSFQAHHFASCVVLQSLISCPDATPRPVRQTLVSWPPTKADGAVRYWGSLRAGVLFLTWPPPAAEESRGGAWQRGAGSGAAKKGGAKDATVGATGAEDPGAADAGAPQVTAVRLAGCRCEG